jgi:3-isopropylmalate/(R)-2-methylmalate dehydratase large subunit
LQHKPKTFQVRIEGKLQKGVGAKDIILALIAKIGAGGGTGHVFEYCGSTIRSLSMEERMTICNMSIEGGARAGLIAPDDTTFDYLAGRDYAPKGQAWEQAQQAMEKSSHDEGAQFDKHITLNVDNLAPMITFGTSPAMGSKSMIYPDPHNAHHLMNAKH